MTIAKINQFFTNECAIRKNAIINYMFFDFMYLTIIKQNMTSFYVAKN